MFVQTEVCAQITGLPMETPIILPNQFSDTTHHHSQEFFLHYNILRPIYLAAAKRNYSQQKRPRPIRVMHRLLNKCFIRTNRIRVTENIFSEDSIWLDISQYAGIKKAVVLVMDYEELMKRVIEREFNSDAALHKRTAEKYNSSFWLEVYAKINLTELYDAWFSELERCAIDYLILDSSDLSYEIIKDKTLLPRI